MKNKKDFPFKIGADPEFNLMIQDKKVTAETAIEEVMSSMETDPNGGGYKIGNAGTIGWDGNNSTGEIRPTPAFSPQKLTTNIGLLFASFTNKTQLFDLSTMSYEGSVGGHIHFELPKAINQNTVKMRELHKRMCAFYLPLMIGEDKINLKIRMKESYGLLHDYRVNQMGNKNTYEFRVPSAEWLTTAKITYSTLAYLTVVFHEALNNPKSFKNLDYIHTTEKQGQALQQLALSDYTFLSKMVLQKARQTIKKFEYYKAYKQQIEYILKPHLVLKDKKRANNNIAQGWNLIKYRTPSKKDLFNKKLLQDRTKKIDLDLMTDMIYLPYNNDAKIENFIRDIKHRIIAYNWKFHNLYYFFGLKKGIEDFFVMDKDLNPLYGFERQCKNLSDVDSIKETFYRMTKKFDKEINKTTTDNPKRQIMIGIPYSMRIDGDSKKLIELIFNIEKNFIKSNSLNFKNLIDDRLNPNGLIYNLKLNNQNETPNIRLSPDRSDRASNILNEVLDEENHNQELEGGTHSQYNNSPNQANNNNSDHDEGSPVQGYSASINAFRQRN